MGPAEARFEFAILQTGELRVGPGGERREDATHRCASVLIWPEGETPSRANTLVTDPCYYTRAGFAMACEALRDLGIGWGDVGRVHVTHPHADHRPRFADRNATPGLRPFVPGESPFEAMRLVPCPGHGRDERALVYVSSAGEEVWVVGDAILNEVWLRSTEVCMTAIYFDDEVCLQWRSMGRIMTEADLVIPGHGAPFRVTASLLEELVRRFPGARCGADCPDVTEALKGRLARMG